MAIQILSVEVGSGVGGAEELMIKGESEESSERIKSLSPMPAMRTIYCLFDGSSTITVQSYEPVLGIGSLSHSST